MHTRAVLSVDHDLEGDECLELGGDITPAFTAMPTVPGCLVNKRIVAEVGTTNMDFIGCVFEPLAFTFSPAVPNHEVGIIFTFINRLLEVGKFIFIFIIQFIFSAAKYVTLSSEGSSQL